jgi:hypothetical protein
VHGGELVEQLWVDKLESWLEEFSTNQQGQNSTKDEHGEREQQVQCSNVFVVGCIHPTTPPVGSVVMIMVVCDLTV